MYREIKQKAYEILEHKGEPCLIGKVFNYFIVLLIVFNILSVIFETVDSIYSPYSGLFWDFEIFSVAIFSIEYAARLWVCNTGDRYPGAVKGRIRYMLSPLAIVDLLAIVPFYLPVLIPLDMRFMRVLRLFRLFRVFKLARYSESLNMLGRIIRDRKEDLFITVFIITIVLVISSTMMYYAEHEAQPEKFDSIPNAMYWGIITLATVGYGDIYPVTTLGKFFSTIIALTGIAMFALPAGIIGSSFIEERQKSREKEIEIDIEKTLETDIENALEKSDICPHCGKSRLEPVSPKVRAGVEKGIEAAPLLRK
jgi:voltage-gated potassium channel